MPFHSFLRQHPSSPIVRHHKPLPPPLPPPPAAAAPHTPAMSTSSAVEMIFEGASAKVSEGTQIALSTITHSGIAENYLTPLIRTCRYVGVSCGGHRAGDLFSWRVVDGQHRMHYRYRKCAFRDAGVHYDVFRLCAHPIAGFGACCRWRTDIFADFHTVHL
ncbi:hypothetical protein BC939DRAFT_490486 [Gamsiella multidivaricata]|uniref:uncharacterized protein n=1 Tax=Gamsiella multidivaricata TaxID=101098 RepID=UPI00221FD72C|nr:uncharacterized protein BC939DRAFT_490486 [Gamsiella multidivaricata]KAI7829488.1 hypothetical protein BC939DRAFT_490486 [Gamsiella multidivaricata]